MKTCKKQAASSHGKKNTTVGHRKGSGIAGNPGCFGVGALVSGAQCWASAGGVCVW